MTYRISYQKEFDKDGYLYDQRIIVYNSKKWFGKEKKVYTTLSDRNRLAFALGILKLNSNGKFHVNIHTRFHGDNIFNCDKDKRFLDRNTVFIFK